MKKSVCFILILTAFHFTAVSQKTEQDSIKNYKLDEIIIQSPKYNRNIFEIPAAASMVSERLIENNRVESLTDVSTLIPNFFMPDYGSKLTSPVYIRGVGNRINTPSVGLYVDDIPYFEKSAFNFDFYDVERIEVLRGPQGTLYGRNAMGGLINVITNKPRQKQATSVSMDYGSYNQIRANITHNQPVGKSLAIKGSLNQVHNSGFYENAFAQSQVDKLNSYSGRLKALFSPSGKFNALANFQYEDSRQGGYPYAVFNREQMEANAINYNEESIYNRKLFSSGLNLNYSAPGFSIRSVSSFQLLDDLQEIDQDFTPLTLAFAAQDQKLHILAQEINIESSNTEVFNWMFGVFGFRQLLDKIVTVEFGEDGRAMFNLPFSEYYTVTTQNHANSGIAFFHQSTLDLGDFTFSAGIRADYEKATLDYAEDRFMNGNPNRAVEFDSDMDFFEILPKIAVKYSINPYFVPYATIAKGYNPGGFNSRIERDEDQTFEPEHSWNYEAGIKAKWLQQRIYVNLAFFYIDWTNQQVYQPVPSGAGSMLTNAGRSESKGVELELKALPAQNLETWLNFGFNDAKFVEYAKDENEDFSGNHLPYVPQYSFNLGGNYTVEVNNNWLDRIRFNLSYNGFGKHYWHESNDAYQDFYGLLNHRISFDKNNITFSFWGKNILNTEYNSFYFLALGNSYVQIGKPATVGVNLKVAF